MEVILHIYKLGNANNFWCRTFLPAVGMGAYHTCIQLDGKLYTFDALKGIIVQNIRNVNITRLSDGELLEQSITLGNCHLTRGEIQEIVNRLQKDFFYENAYHLVHRNCNHFSETFALALLQHDELIEKGPDPSIKNSNYPTHINRLAGTSGLFIKHDDDIVPCKPLEEAATVVGAAEKVGWTFGKKLSSKSTKTILVSKQKKELTKAQKAALEKLRKK